MTICKSLIISVLGGGKSSFPTFLVALSSFLLLFTIALCGCEQPVFDPLENQEDPAYTRADSLAADSTATLGITIKSAEWGDPYYIGAF